MDSRIQKFHDVLSPFPYSIGSEIKSPKSGTTYEQRILRKDNEGNLVESPPATELSDGQIAIQGLATLFAASVEYRWCNWSTLILDDPLQSSDLIHASAFIDIIRGLVREMGYQIFISSHDIDEADFIARKCERSGIRVARCHLEGPGVDGVRYRTS